MKRLIAEISELNRALIRSHVAEREQPAHPDRDSPVSPSPTGDTGAPGEAHAKPPVPQSCCLRLALEMLGCFG